MFIFFLILVYYFQCFNLFCQIYYDDTINVIGDFGVVSIMILLTIIYTAYYYYNIIIINFIKVIILIYLEK